MEKKLCIDRDQDIFDNVEVVSIFLNENIG